MDAAAARELLEQGMTDEEAASALGVGTHKFAEWRREEGIKPNRKAAAPQETAEHDTGGKEQSESAEMVGGHAEPYVTVAKLHDILTAALAGKMGHAAVTVQGQRFRSMALRISYTIGGRGSRASRRPGDGAAGIREKPSPFRGWAVVWK